MELVQEIDDLIIFASIIWGAVICFFGYRIFRIVIAIIDFFVGATLATVLYFVGVFLLGAAGGALIGTLFRVQIGAGLEPVIVIILAIIGGIVAIVLQKLIIIIYTYIHLSEDPGVSYLEFFTSRRMALTSLTILNVSLRIPRPSWVLYRG